MSKSKDRSMEIYQVILKFIEEHQYAPSIQDICLGTGLKSKSSVHYYLNELERKGLIERDYYKGRSIRINGSSLISLKKLGGRGAVERPPFRGNDSLYIQLAKDIHQCTRDLERYVCDARKHVLYNKDSTGEYMAFVAGHVVRCSIIFIPEFNLKPTESYYLEKMKWYREFVERENLSIDKLNYLIKNHSKIKENK